MPDTNPEVTDPDETVIEFHDKTPDSFGRRHFTAFWLSDNIGPRCDETGVRGQCFHADPIEFARRAESKGRTIRHLN